MKVSGALEQQPKIIAAHLVLIELKPNGVNVFASEKLPIGQKLSFVLKTPRHFYCKGQVICYRDVRSDSKVIAAKPYHHRLHIKFLFENAEEQDAAKQLSEELATSNPLIEKGNMPKEETPAEKPAPEKPEAA